MLQGYSVRIGSSDGVQEQDFTFTLRTPDRTYNLSSTSEADRDEWISQLSHIIERPMGNRDFARKIFKSKSIKKDIFQRINTRFVF